MACGGLFHDFRVDDAVQGAITDASHPSRVMHILYLGSVVVRFDSCSGTWAGSFAL